MPEGFYEWVGGKKIKSNNPDTSIYYCVKVSPEWVDKIERHLITGFKGLWRYLIKDSKIDIEGRDRSGIGSPILFRWGVHTIPDHLLSQY